MAITRKANKFYMSETALVQYVEYLNERTIEEHLHDFVEIVYILKGRCIHVIDGAEYIMKHGDLLIMNYNNIHGMKAEKGLKYVNILLKPQYINQSLIDCENAFELLKLSEFEEFREILDKSKSKITFSGDERERFESIISTLLNEIEKKPPGHEIAVRSQFNILLITIFRKMAFELDGTFNSMSEKLLNYIKKHCSEKLTLEGIARQCSYNPSYFSRMFKEYTGYTFIGYLKKIRMQKAVDMVLNSDMNITDIVYATGYSDATKFFKHFKEYTGLTPLKLRKSKR